MAPLVEQKLSELRALCEQFGMQRMFVFGSAARGADFHAASDVDLLYRLLPEIDDLPWDTRPDVWAMKDAFEKLLARDVDLISIPSVTNPYFIAKVNTEKVKIYEA